MATVFGRVQILLLLLILLALLAVLGMLATRSDAGSLDPPFAPSSTMRTLEEVYDAWHRRLPANDGSLGGDFLPPAGCESSRFKCVLWHGSISFRQYPAVLDLETGLVWERVPGTTYYNWLNATSACRSKQLGQRMGWRLPSVEEFNSLRDTLSTNSNGIPVGAPFLNFDGVYWTGTVYGGALDSYAPSYAYTSQLISWPKSTTESFRAWCVRGGSGAEEVMTP